MKRRIRVQFFGEDLPHPDLPVPSLLSSNNGTASTYLKNLNISFGGNQPQPTPVQHLVKSSRGLLDGVP